MAYFQSTQTRSGSVRLRSSIKINAVIIYLRKLPTTFSFLP